MGGLRHPLEGVVYADAAAAGRLFASGAWIDRTIGQALAGTAARFPNRPAFISDERMIGFAELHAASDRLAATMLKSGLRPGDRAIFQIGTTVDSVLMLVAAYKAGIIPVCAVPQYRELEIGQLAEQSAARAHIVQADFSAFDLVAFAQAMKARHDSIEHVIVIRSGGAGTTSLDPLANGISAEEAAAILAAAAPGSRDTLSFQLSGGTTGVPKIIPRFHGEYLGHAAAWMRRIRLDEDGRMIWSLPLLHNAGQLYALMPALLSGVTTVLMPRVDIPRMLELIETHQATHALSIGPIAPSLIAYPDVSRHDLSSLRLFGTMNRADALEAHLGVPCANLFGMTEGLLLGSPADAPEALRHLTQGASGCPEDEVRLVDLASGADVPDGEVGELRFRGPSSLLGYYRAPEATAAALTTDGFVRTGDLMKRHRVGGWVGYSFEGRIRDNVNRGGEKIGCEEVEAIVAHHPSVADAKLVAMPDPIYGEKGCIFVILRPGAKPPSIPELIELFVSRGVAKFKCPERIEIIDEFPVTRVGKFDRAALKQRIGAQLEAERRPQVDGAPQVQQEPGR
jgi:non-ribosomal peptide synthetase component E (peptide arylation enzyme)